MSRTKARPRTTPKKPTTTTVDPAPVTHLPYRQPTVTDAQANAASATLYAGSIRIHAPHTTWTGHNTNTATTDLDTGTRLLYTRNPGHALGRIEAAHECPHGIWHTQPIADGRELPAFTQAATECTAHNPRAQRAQALGTGIHRATTSAHDTQTLTRDDIDAGLTARAAADTDQMKEHPQS
ncbi:hypothetical protein ACWCPT_29670 [Streptomyces sp. NPDC002308]